MTVMRKTGYKGSYKQGTEPTNQSVSLLAPNAGLNTRDPLSQMDAAYAINLTNFIATPQGVTVREGNSVNTTGLPGYVETLAPYTATVAGSDKLFAWSNGGIYDVTNPGVVGTAVVSSLTNSRWSYVNMTGSSGQYLICTNGVDAARHYDGTNWVTWTNVASPVNPGEINGVSPAQLTRPIVHQRRVWFVQENSSKGWYLPINSIGGTITALDFGPVFPRGGKLMDLASWSMDGGNGIRNFLVAISENGDAVIYEGTDPSSSSSWSISGTWRLAAPAAAQCLFQFGGDTLYLSVDGLMPLSQYMQDANNAVALSDSIRPTLSSLSISQTGLSGWQIHDVLTKNLLILNVPQIDPNANIQFVFNTITKGWSLFTGWPAQCWATLNGITYFGGYQQVHKAFVGYKDASDVNGDGGSIYTASAQQAYTYLSDNHRAKNKHFTLARVNIVTASSQPNFALAVNTDFDTTPPSNIGAAVAVTSSLWDLSIWDVATWSGGVSNYNAWQSVAAHGYCASIVLAVSVLAETTWVSTDLSFEMGGVLS